MTNPTRAQIEALVKRAYHAANQCVTKDDAIIRELAAALEDLTPAEPQPALTCRKCGGQMRAGIATGQTFTAGMPDDLGGDVQTFSAGGPGHIIDCMKCAECGWSVTSQPAIEEVKPLILRMKALIAAYDKANWMRTADYHGDECDCLRCHMDAMRAALAKQGGA